MAKKPMGLKIDVEASIAHLAQQPQITQGGTIRLGDLIVSAHGVSDSQNGSSKQLSPEQISLSDVGTLGRGASGLVRKVRNTHSNTYMALKEIKLTSESHLSEIRRELLTLHNPEFPECPYLVDFFGAYSQEGSVFIAMECMEGSLADMARVPPNILALMTADILQGLYYLHKIRHLVHRDIKPSNLLYNRKGVVKVSDFGVSSQLDSTMANAHSFVGTVTYMSPERLKGEAYGTPGDIWSFGITIAELALGSHPYAQLVQHGSGSSGGTEARFWKLVQHMNQVNTPALELPVDIDTDLRDLIMRCVAKDPAERPPTWELLDHPFLVKHCGPQATRDYAANHQTVLQWLSAVDPKRVQATPAATPKVDVKEATPKEAVSQGGLEQALKDLVDIGSM